MNVFMSWSGGKSLAYAEEIKKLIENCIQSAKVFCSSEDIQNGENWANTLFDALRGAKFGIICLTKENMNSSWINFEAGAIVSKLENKMTAMLIDIGVDEITSPLSLYQASKIEKNSLLQLILAINKTLDTKIDEERIKKSFNHFYNDFSENIAKFVFSEGKQQMEAISFKELLKYSKDIYDIVHRIEEVMPSIIDEVDTIKKTDYQKKYDILFDKIFVFLVEIDGLDENNFKDICDRFLIKKILNFVDSCMKKDRYLKNRCNNRYMSIVDKYKKYSNFKK